MLLNQLNCLYSCIESTFVYHFQNLHLQQKLTTFLKKKNNTSIVLILHSFSQY